MNATETTPAVSETADRARENVRVKREEVAGIESRLTDLRRARENAAVTGGSTSRERQAIAECEADLEDARTQERHLASIVEQESEAQLHQIGRAHV